MARKVFFTKTLKLCSNIDCNPNSSLKAAPSTGTSSAASRLPAEYAGWSGSLGGCTITSSQSNHTPEIDWSVGLDVCRPTFAGHTAGTINQLQACPRTEIVRFALRLRECLHQWHTSNPNRVGKEAQDSHFQRAARQRHQSWAQATLVSLPK